MKNLLLTIILTLAASGAAWADGISRTISVSGSGMAVATPDMATLSIGVSKEAGDATGAMSEASRVAAEILNLLATLGIDRRDTQTRDLSLQPVWTRPSSSSDERPQIAGYRAENTIVVRVRDLDRLGEIVDGAMRAGGNRFSGLSFGVQQDAALKSRARKAAVANAMAKATELAEAAGVTLGPVLVMSDQPVMTPQPRMMEVAAAPSPLPVAAGELSVSASVSMTFAIGD